MNLTDFSIFFKTKHVAHSNILILFPANARKRFLIFVVDR